MTLNPPRKRAAEGDNVAKTPKKRKRVHKDEAEDHLDLEKSINLSIGLMDSQLLSDYFARMTTRSGSDLSEVELGDLSLPARCFQDTTRWQEKRQLDVLPQFVESFVDDAEQLRMAPDAKGAPHTLVVTAAALRAADIVRTMRKFSSKENTVAKLFAKHIKLEDQAKQLRKSRTGIAVGTPARLMRLLDTGALSLDHLQRIVVDASHIDQKKMGIMEIKDTMLSLAKLLSRADLRERYDQEEKRLLLLFY